MKRKPLLMVLAATVSLSLGGCGTPVVMEDCFVLFRLAAWQDEDGDGHWDATELPLEGVKIQTEGSYAQSWGYPYLTDEDGQLTLEIWYPGRCERRDYTVAASPTERYEPTTPVSVTVSLSSREYECEVQFGFRALSD